MIVGDGETIGSSEVLGGCGFKLPGSGMTAASLNGTYMLYQFMDNNIGVGSFVTIRARATFDGAGSVTYSEIARSAGSLDPGGAGTYAVADDGTFLIDGVMPGVVIQDGSAFGIVYYDVGENSVSITIGIKQ